MPAAISSRSTLATLALRAISVAAACGMIPSSACAKASAASKSNHFCTRFSSLKIARSASVPHKCLSRMESKTPEGMWVHRGVRGAGALPYTHSYDMASSMKTTLDIDATVMAELKREAARQGRTMSEMVETALRLLLHSQGKREVLPALPTFRSGGALVDLADR